MKKVHIMMAFLLLAILTGCRYVENTSTTATTRNNIDENAVKGSLYLIEDSKENLISIQIPTNVECNENHVALIQEYITQKLQNSYDDNFCLVLSQKDINNKSREYNNCYIEVQSEVVYSSEELVSIVFEGFFNRKSAAHPSDFLWTLNFNPRTLEPVTFSEKYLVNEALYNVFAQEAQNRILALCDGEWPENWDSFSEAICPKDRFLDGLALEEDFYVYYTEGGIGISYPVSYVMGDHMEVYLPYSLLQMVD